MELKHGLQSPCTPLACFNRTFMELKPSETKSETTLQPGFNRTFMELKHLRCIAGAFWDIEVLIVPLWN